MIFTNHNIKYIMTRKIKNIAIFASGNGSNAENIIKHTQALDNMQVALVLSNSAKAKVLQRAAKYNVPTMVFDRQRFYQQQDVLEALRAHDIDLVVLAGFMWLVPSYLIAAFPNRIMNIHPALLPAYGGKGMYGHHVHQAVKAAKETKTGITIHYVNEAYDEGQIIFQAETAINSTDSPDNIAQKVHALEYEHYPKVIEKVLNNEI